jgi:hypothetical protein
MFFKSFSMGRALERLTATRSTPYPQLKFGFAHFFIDKSAFVCYNRQQIKIPESRSKVRRNCDDKL